MDTRAAYANLDELDNQTVTFNAAGNTIAVAAIGTGLEVGDTVSITDAVDAANNAVATI